MQSEHSAHTAEFKVGTDTYQIQLLTTQAAFKLQFVLTNQLGGLATGSGINLDPDLMWSLAEKLLKFAEVNGYPLDIEKHFAGKVEELDLVVFEALKANMPGLVKKLSGTITKAIAAKFGSEKSQSE